jgi:hypothetical protein
MIEFNKAKLKEFKAAYDVAKSDGRDEFVFEGQLMLVFYAKYLILYLESQLELETWVTWHATDG